MLKLTPSERRALRAKAHHLHPVVYIGQHGLTPAVLHEIDIALTAHELIKVRVASDQRDEREALLVRICEEMDAAPVQHLGKVLTLWRPAPKEEKPPLRPKPAPRASPAATSSEPRRERRRAPPTTKGPFEPGRRNAPPGAGATRRRRRQP
jgi:putative YhbY family RNA-binding protein